MITTEYLLEVLGKIAQLLELKGENPFKIRAYRQGAEAIEAYQGDFLAKAKAGELDGIPGIGEALRKKLHELASTGQMEFYDKLRADYPESLFELFEVNGLGPKKIALLHRELGVASLADLKRVCEDGSAAALTGFGGKTVTKLLEALAFRESHAGTFRAGDVAADVETILHYLKGHASVSQAEIAGSYRRGKETVHDLDFVVATAHGAAVLADVAAQPFVQNIIACGETKTSFHLASGLQCDVRAVSSTEYPFALAYFTGSKEHNVAIRSRALKRGWSLNEYRLENCPDPIHDERDLYQALGLSFVPPELREARGEIEHAENGTLPTLIETSHLRGTFHNHTTASDGEATLAAMADAAQELGLQYLGIADHSKASFQARGLDEGRLLAQIAEIRALNEKTAPHFRLLTGSEVDIMKDGSLDFSDEVMAQLDYVVASVHSVFTLSEEEMTARIIRAMENPYVTMLGHLTGRLLLKREPYAVNIPAILDAAVRTGTIIELNASPWRLDMDWRWWSLAKEKGVKCAINPDAHSTHGLQDLFFGVRTARKGGLSRHDVINCLPYEEMMQVLQAKRRKQVS